MTTLSKTNVLSIVILVVGVVWWSPNLEGSLICEVLTVSAESIGQGNGDQSWSLQPQADSGDRGGFRMQPMSGGLMSLAFGGGGGAGPVAMAADVGSLLYRVMEPPAHWFSMDLSLWFPQAPLRGLLRPPQPVRS